MRGSRRGPRSRAGAGRHGDRHQPVRARGGAGRRGRPRAAGRRRRRARAAARPAAVRPHRAVGAHGAVVRARPRALRRLALPAVAAVRADVAPRRASRQRAGRDGCARHRRAPAGDGGEPARLPRAVLRRDGGGPVPRPGRPRAPGTRRPQRIAGEPRRGRVRRRARRGTRRPLSGRGRLPPRLARVPSVRLHERAVRLQPGGHRADGGERPRPGADRAAGARLARRPRPCRPRRRARDWKWSPWPHWRPARRW